MIQVGRIILISLFVIFINISIKVERVLPVIAACFTGNSGTLEKVIRSKKFDINQLDNHQASALHVAVVYGHQKCIEMLLENGATVDLKGFFLYYYFIIKNNINNIKFFNILDKDKKTALHKAAFYGREDALRTLIAHKADLNSVDRKGVSALHIAVHKNYPTCMEILLEKNANPSLVDKSGWTPLHYSAYKNRLALCEALISSNVDIMIRDKNNNSAIDIAIARGFASTASVLFEGGAYVY